MESTKRKTEKGEETMNVNEERKLSDTRKSEIQREIEVREQRERMRKWANKQKQEEEK